MTAEEKAFRDKIDRVELEELMYDEFYELIAEAIKIGKANGHEEAMRWRDPKEELPKDEQVLIKTDKDEILLVTYWVEKGDFVYWDAPVYNVIGWRPIE